MTRNNRYLVVFQGGDHRIYGGRIFSLSARNDQRFQSAIIRVSSYFWKAVLQKDEKAEMVLNGYNLRNLLGGIATVERHLDTIEMDTTEAAQPSGNTEKPETKKAKSESIEEFPVTQLYRNITRKYADKL
jgi:hypothetical protein